MPRGSKIVKLLMELPSKDRIVFSSCYLDDDDTLWVAPGDIASVPHKAPMEHCRQLDINWGNFAKFLKLANFLGVDISDIMCSSEESASEDGAALENSGKSSTLMYKYYSLIMSQPPQVLIRILMIRALLLVPTRPTSRTHPKVNRTRDLQAHVQRT